MENGVDKDHIIEIALDGIEYEELRDPKKCFQYIKNEIKAYLCPVAANRKSPDGLRRGIGSNTVYRAMRDKGD